MSWPLLHVPSAGESATSWRCGRWSPSSQSWCWSAGESRVGSRGGEGRQVQVLEERADDGPRRRRRAGSARSRQTGRAPKHGGSPAWSSRRSTPSPGRLGTLRGGSRPRAAGSPAATGYSLTVKLARRQRKRVECPSTMTIRHRSSDRRRRHRHGGLSAGCLE